MEPFYVVTARFNNETLETNYAYRKKKQAECIYCVPLELSPKIPYHSPVFVIEMNNSNNKILGIGLIKNMPETKYYKVHTDANTNRYTYIGKRFMDRDLINDLNPRLVFILEQILFKGYTHSKRGSGLTSIPEKVVKIEMEQGNDIKRDIYSLFIPSKE
jgi:hypothetical protein